MAGTFVSGMGVNVPRLHCHYHPEAELIEDYSCGDMVCSACGLVVADRVIDLSSEWRTFNDDQGTGKDMCRVGYAEDAFYGEDLSTRIEGNSQGVVKQFKKSAKQTAHQTACAHIKELCSRMNITKNVRDNAMDRFKKVCDMNGLKGKDKKAVMTVILYVECRRMKVTRSVKEFHAATGVCKKLFSKILSLLNRTEVTQKKEDDKETKNSGAPAEDFVWRFCSFLSLSFEISNKAKKIIEKITAGTLLGGCTPTTTAAAAIYLAAVHSGCTKDPKDVATIAGISEVTMKKSLAILMPHIKELLI